ncbi:hypothetical protein O6H91_05G021700 [Diphasiastrum complanatum]|uniref:Uncharacterized protein n=2 Tax=Diphasiastrum complanatum TaxID=34168 RepID=A0ACC2DLM9_DIPCM|nr:hypothetical protein O6H91_05G020900 [Diphasiastrum complanatum]KAJ7555083.1 hypothetical protein O6H91_05G021700 [Diphasiastrum complanatum]
MAEREGALILTAQDDPLPKAIELIEGLGLPGGLLPLEDVVECGYVEQTGFVWITQKHKNGHYFKKASRQVAYAEKITCTLQKNRLKNVTGVKAKELLIWVPVNEIAVDEPPSSKIHFKSLAGITRTFPVDAFARGE